MTDSDATPGTNPVWQELIEETDHSSPSQESGMTMETTAEMIDAGARYLRETQQAGKRLTPWESTPNATKKKWRLLSEGVLRAALTRTEDRRDA